jgi:2-polyprenyl-3-methyl-5-hydroxy-6-metoxy-1,4-benzoquinol methylase
MIENLNAALLQAQQQQSPSNLSPSGPSPSGPPEPLVEHRRHRLAGEYESKPERYYSSDREDIRQLIPAGVKRLLDVGCGNGAFGRSLKQERGPSLYVAGLELTSWAQTARQHLDAVYQVDAERDDLHVLGKFDCVTFNDVLEHLFDPWNVVQRISAQLEPGGYIIASSPNIRFFHVLKALVMNKRFDYEESGVMDRTHVRFFTFKTFPELFESANLQVVSTGGTGDDGRFPWKLNLLNRLLGGALDDTRYPQIYCVARKQK